MIHRQDLTPEQLAALEAMFPGMEVRCVGDMPDAEIPPEIQAQVAAFEEKRDLLFFTGRCLDCEKQMDGFPDGELPDDWRPQEGWKHFTEGGVIVAWQCPECDAKDSSDVRFVGKPQ